MGGQRGQASVEWVGLVLVAALALGALAALRERAGDRSLGEAVARRFTCAARGACAAAAPAVPAAPVVPAAPGLAGRPGPRARGRARTGRPRPARAVDALRRLRAVGALAKRVWIVCLGYRRAMYELDHPRAPTEPMPLEEALEIADACLNPAAFLESG
jgi:hypothetical protein